MNLALAILFSYLAGSIPSALWVGRIVKKIDIRDHGSGNMGAANTARTLGFQWAVVVGVMDVLKGFAPVFWLGPWAATGASMHVADVRLILGALAIVGHLFPVFASFKGGKGVLTATGVFLAVLPVELGIAILAWIGVFLLTRIVSIGSLAAVTVLVIAVCVRRFFFGIEIPDSLVATSVLIAVLVYITHRTNIKRLLRGEEAGFKR